MSAVNETAVSQSSDAGELTLSGMPATRTIVDAVVAKWPQHSKYIVRSFKARTSQQLVTTEFIAQAALILTGDRLATFADHYRWTCDRIREEEIHFHRTGRYRLQTFAEAIAEVYSNPDYMAKYMDGLLLTQVLWFNHAASFDFFLTEARRRMRPDARYLEVGPGHGLMMYLAIRDLGFTSAEAWDVSSVSIAQTRKALESLRVVDRAIFEVKDIMARPARPQMPYDLVVISEVLEHLERPQDALASIRPLVAENGLVFVNVPVNSPSPDHLYLFESPQGASALVENAGFRIVHQGFFATQGMSLDRAAATKVSVSCAIFATPS